MHTLKTDMHFKRSRKMLVEICGRWRLKSLNKFMQYPFFPWLPYSMDDDCKLEKNFPETSLVEEHPNDECMCSHPSEGQSQKSA